ncbi:MAG: hypothetical protein H7066_05030 [Cytophagaceae bacterium]|nr:hypothetical protein [Gemmatimonadaceae bacterium]
MFRRRTWLYAGAALLASCSFVTDSCACVLVPAAWHVVGTVTVAGGNEPMVSLVTSTHRGACGSPASGSLVQQGAQTVPVGHYRVSVATEEGMHCAIVTAGLGPRAKRDSVSVLSSFQADSARLDLVIP